MLDFFLILVLREDFRVFPKDIQVAQGERALLPCVPPRGHPEPQVSWLRNSQKLDLTVAGR